MSKTAAKPAEVVDAKLQQLLDKRDELLLIRDILALQYEIKRLKADIDGPVNTEESEGE